MWGYPHQAILGAAQRAVVVLSILLAGGVGCGGGAPEVTVVMTDFAFEPDQFALPRGQKTTLKLQNKGAVDHDFSIPQLNLSSAVVRPGQTGTLDIAIPRGPLRVVCTLPGHEDAGMVAQITLAPRSR